MKRRTHKKSRGGCLECKRRHIKCDERPLGCGNCTAAERRCQYPGHSAASTSPGALLATDSRGPIPQRFNENGTSSSLPNFLADLHDQLVDPVVNINHMELMVHFSTAVVVPELDESILDGATDLLLKTSLEAPYLLHEFLSFSARHLSIVKPEKADFYLHQAVQLQTRSISMFKATQLLVDRSNCVPMLLYSSCLGRHLLADCLVYPASPYPAFHEKFLQTIHLMRGVRAVASGSWHVLLESKLNRFLTWGSPPLHADCRGDECDNLRYLLEQSHLDDATIETYQRAIDLIQIGFDELNDPTEGRNPYALTISWLVTVSEDFVALLEQGHAEAIAVLGYYSVLLHKGRGIWQIANAGAQLLRAIYEHLGPDWDVWLSWPRSVIFG
ncbi:hypothetical protein BX600DRAFT_382673 [Xylariales sp. PMI_506]|nr:hypothetical protein BX600DRAFT_382673 [Xylariales sp. PMI_506]